MNVVNNRVIVIHVLIVQNHFHHRVIYHDIYLYIHVKKPCLCPECGQQFSQISSLERHQRTKHLKDQNLLNTNTLSSSSSSLFQCSICHEYFSLKHNLKMHERKLHQSLTDYNCSFCSANFTCNASLQKHINFRHRSLSSSIKAKQQTTHSLEIKEQQTNNTSECWQLSNHDQLTSTGNTLFDSTPLCCSDERSSFFSDAGDGDLFGNSSTNRNQCDSTPTPNIFDWPSLILMTNRQQQVHYQILKCDEIN